MSTKKAGVHNISINSITSVPPAIPRIVGTNPPAVGTSGTGTGVLVEATATLTGVGVCVAFGVPDAAGVRVARGVAVGFVVTVGVGVRDGAPGGVQQTYPTGSALQSATTSYRPSAKHVEPGIHWFGSSDGPGVGVRVDVGVAVGEFVGATVTVGVTVGVTPGGIQQTSPATEHTSVLSDLPSLAHCD